MDRKEDRELLRKGGFAEHEMKQLSKLRFHEPFAGHQPADAGQPDELGHKQHQLPVRERRPLRRLL